MTGYALSVGWPPSVNHYYARSRYGGVHLTKIGKAYKEETGWTLRAGGIEPMAGGLQLTCWLFRPNKRGDIDNYFKALLDSLKGHLYIDDIQIEQLVTYRLLDRDNPRVELLCQPSMKPPLPPSTLYPTPKGGNLLYRLD